jgi:hypothetical protein
VTQYGQIEEQTSTVSAAITITIYSPTLVVTEYTSTAKDFVGTSTIVKEVTVTRPTVVKQAVTKRLQRRAEVTSYCTTTSTYNCGNNPDASCYSTVYGISYESAQA